MTLAPVKSIPLARFKEVRVPTYHRNTPFLKTSVEGFTIQPIGIADEQGLGIKYTECMYGNVGVW